MTLHEIENELKKIEGIRYRNTLNWERMRALCMEAQGYSDKEIAVALSREKEEYNRKNVHYMSTMRRNFKYDPDRMREIMRDTVENDKEITAIAERICA